MSITVDLHDDVVSLAKRVPVPGPHGAAHAKCEGQVTDDRTSVARDSGRPVRGTVVNDEHVDVLADAADLRDHGTDR